MVDCCETARTDYIPIRTVKHRPPDQRRLATIEGSLGFRRRAGRQQIRCEAA